MKNRPELIRKFILDNIEKYPRDIVSMAMKHFDVTATTVHRHLTRLIKEQRIISTGTTRNKQYFLSSSLDKYLQFDINAKLSEFEVYQQYFDPSFSILGDNVQNILHYAFTEMFNNAIDHSEGKKITVNSKMENDSIVISIADDGIGAFQKITDYLSLSDTRESVLQLSIGKLTTDPKNHTGEGIFFSSRIFDTFSLIANQLHYYRDNYENDWSLTHITNRKTQGTEVIMKIKKNSKSKLVTLFKKFQDPESLAFDRTEIRVELSAFGEEVFISRSQAKRILRNLDKFKKVTLDFTGVKMVGQGFADEVFRVYASQHPQIQFDYINANDDVDFMIKRGLATRQI